MMEFSLKILESNKEIQNRIAKALLPAVSKYMNSIMILLKKELPVVLYSAIVNSPEYPEILRGRLRYEFGIPSPARKLSGLLEIWTENVNVMYTQPTIASSTGNISAKLNVGLVKADYSDVLGTNYAEVYDVVNGYTLPWLKWLLLDGSVPIIKDHFVVIGPNRRSRTGMAVMRQDTNKSWSVPKQYAGTQRDNWITRAIFSSRTEIQQVLEKALRDE